MIVAPKSRARVGLFGLMCVIVVICDLPIITLILNSFRSTEQILSATTIIPTQPSLVNYTYVVRRTSFFLYLRNSGIMAGGGMVASIVAATLAGYALSRFRSAILSGYTRLLILLQMFPILLALIPLFILFRNLHLVNTYFSVLILYTVGQLPFATLMFRAFFNGIPRDLEEAALIDGASRLRSFGLVVLPLAGPAIAAVAIFAFLFSYNEYLIASIFLRSQTLYTVPVGIQQFMQQYATDWGSLMASATIAMLPTFVLFLLIQKYMTYGAIGSGLKG
ncbi:MAG TPA: carbohydrate ABC transporter permease [Chloroflexota bacterium]|nr:carbohydrate ABC transporter permease [Chloroflexota bacterium]